MNQIDPTAWLHESAFLYGDVSIGAGSSVWPYVVMRAEMHHIEIGRLTNIQDFVMIHVGNTTPTVIGDFCSITHHCTIHGATIGDACLIGIGATVMDGVVIGAGSIVAGGSFIPEGKTFPPNSIIMGSPARLKAERDSTKANRLNAWMYNRNANFYRAHKHDAWRGEEFEAWAANIKARIESDDDLEFEFEFEFEGSTQP